MSFRHWEKILKTASVLSFLGLVFCISYFTMHWPLMHDAPLMQYIATAMLNGQVPYKDVFDFNFPGSYFLHVLELSVLGRSDLSWRIFDLVFLLGCMIFSVQWSKVKWVGLISGVTFGFYHLSWGIPSMGQRDFFMAFFLLGGTYCWIRSAENPGWKKIAAGGLLLGMALWIKPTAMLWVGSAALSLSVYAFAKNRKQLIISRGAVGFAAMAFISSLFIFYLVYTGSLSYFREILTQYVFPVHSKDEAWTYTRLIKFIGITFWLPLLVAITGILFTPKRTQLSVAMLSLGVISGMVHFISQKKGWDYHLYPLALFLFVLIGHLWSADWRAWKQVVYGLLIIAVLGQWAFHFYERERIEAQTFESRDFIEMQRLEAALKAKLSPGDEIQVFDTVGGGLNLLYRLRVKLPTRFHYDFVFMHQGNVYVESLKKEYMDALKNRQPQFIICWNNGWLGPDALQDRMAYIPGFIEFTNEHYMVSELSSRRVTVFEKKDLN